MSILSSPDLSAGLPPLSIYVHVPWCLRKCHYCDFNSHQAQQIPEQAYLQALQSDLEEIVPWVWGRPVYTIFIGGGTPSLLSATAIDRILSLIRSLFNVVPDAEITMEANPATAEMARFRDYVQAGVNRLSLGIQSFDDAALQRISRLHDGQTARRAIEIACQVVPRVNLDLMFGLPQQTLTQWEYDLSQALSYGTEHLSLYQFTLEPNTYFAKYTPAQMPDEDTLIDMQDLIASAITGRLVQYEVSAYSRDDASRCLHNLNYWSFGDYIGVGPGAHGKISFPNRIMRTVKTSNPDKWLQATQPQRYAQRYDVPVDELPFEFMLNALRLKEGVPNRYFRERTGLPDSFIAQGMNKGIAKGLISDTPFRIQTTPQGWAFLSDVQSLFLK